MPNTRIRTSPLTAAPRMAPTVLALRTSPTVRPTARRCLAIASPASGNAAPMKSAGTIVYKKASRKLAQTFTRNDATPAPRKSCCSRTALAGMSRRNTVTTRAVTPMTIWVIPNHMTTRLVAHSFRKIFSSAP